MKDRVKSAPFMRARKDQAVAAHKGFKVLKLAYLPYRLPHWEDHRYLGGRGSKQAARQGAATVFDVRLPPRRP